MVVKPPGQIWIAGVFEVNDGILIAVKLHIQKQLPCPVSQPFVVEIRILVDTVAIKIAEHGGGSQAVKAVVMKKYFYLHTAIAVAQPMSHSLEFQHLPETESISKIRRKEWYTLP